MSKIIIPIVVTILVLVFLINSAIEESSRKVLTVKELINEAKSEGFISKDRIRLGARVSSSDISVSSVPERIVSFYIKDIDNNDSSVDKSDGVILVNYNGLMPDTLREGRDVILEGSFNGKVFLANTLNTQCPSKYEPPDPSNPLGSSNLKSGSY